MGGLHAAGTQLLLGPVRKHALHSSLDVSSAWPRLGLALKAPAHIMSGSVGAGASRLREATSMPSRCVHAQGRPELLQPDHQQQWPSSLLHSHAHKGLNARQCHADHLCVRTWLEEGLGRAGSRGATP